MKRKAARVLITAMGVALVAAPAAAQVQCFHRADVEQALEGLGESLYAKAMGDDGNPREIWVSPDGSFTVFIAPRADVLCPSDSGKDLKIVGHMGRPS